MRPIRVLIVSPHDKTAWRWITGLLDPDAYEWTFRFLGAQSTVKRLFRAFFLPTRLSRYDIVISPEYFVSFGICARLFFTRATTPHICYSFNQSRRLLKFGRPWLDRLVNRIFSTAALFVVHSRHERAQFNRLHDIDLGKLYFSHFAITLPEFRPDIFSQFDKPYVCMVGRNNRDIATFMAAMSGLDIAGVVITSRKAQDAELETPENVSIYYDLDLNACLDCLAHATANVTLVKDGERGAGHITTVFSMLLGKPQIVSDVPSLVDYVVGGRHGISVPLGDVAATRAAIREIVDRPDLAAQYGAAAKRYADAWFGEEREAKQLGLLIRNVLEDAKTQACDATWLAEFCSLRDQAAPCQPRTPGKRET